MTDVQRAIERIIAADSGQEMLNRLSLWYRWLHTQTCLIRDIHGRIVPLIPNDAQDILIATMMSQSLAGKPVRIVILKARKRGISTLVQSLFLFLASHYENQLGYTLAHSDDSTRLLHGIGKQIAAGYRLVGSEPRESMIQLPDTSSSLHYRTAAGLGVGAGGSPNLLHLSERALWSGNNAEETEYTSTQAVPYVPTSIIIYESTARGKDHFFKLYELAHDPESAYIPLFVPWFENDDCRIPTEPLTSLTDDEIALRKDGLDDECLAWRRMKHLEIGPGLFRQEYPSTPEEAVSYSADLVIPGLSGCIIDALPFNPQETKHHVEKVGGIDFGHADCTAIITGHYVDQVLYVTRVWRERRSLAEDQVEGLEPYHSYYCDPAALSARIELQAATAKENQRVRLHIAPRAKDSTARKVQHEWAMLAKMVREDRLKIMRNASRQLLIEASAFCYSDKTGEPRYYRSEEVGHFDTMDALRYLVMAVTRYHSVRDDDGPPMRIISGRRESMRRF